VFAKEVHRQNAAKAGRTIADHLMGQGQIPSEHSAQHCPRPGKRPRQRGAPPNFKIKASGGQLGRLDIQHFVGAHDRDRPRLHGLRDLAHEVDVKEPVRCVESGDTCGVSLKLSIRFFGAAVAGARFFFGFRPRLFGIGKQWVAGIR
jgi:hypothetical protein